MVGSPPLHERRLLGVRGLAAARDGPALERVAERLHERHPHQRLRADDARDRGARGPRRRRAARRARAAAGRAPVRVAAVPARRARPAHAALEPALGDPAATPRAGSSSIARARQRHAPVGRPEGGARPLLRVARARAARAARRRPVARMVQCVRSVADSPFFRYPNIRLNQINFAAELQACAVSMTGDPTLLRRDYRRQLARFLRGAKRPVRPWRIPNLGPSYNFHRNPFQRAGRAAEHRVGRVRQHRARRHLLLRAGAARGDDADLRGARRARCGPSCGARCPPTGRTAAT